MSRIGTRPVSEGVTVTTDLVAPPSWADRRERQRIDVTLSVTMRERNRNACKTWLLDVSATGCRVSDAVVGPGNMVWVTFEGLAPLEGVVCWTAGMECGVKFRQPLHEAVLRHLLERLQRSTALA